MDDTTRATIEKISVRYDKPTKIPSGEICTVFYDSVRLSPADLARLAAEAIGHLPEHSFDIAVGIAYTGILFAAAVAGGREVAILTEEKKELVGPSVKGKKVLIVDDVVLKGKKVIDAKAVVEKAGGTVVGFACIVDRSEGKFSGGAPLWTAFQTEMI